MDLYLLNNSLWLVNWKLSSFTKAFRIFCMSFIAHLITEFRCFLGAFLSRVCFTLLLVALYKSLSSLYPSTWLFIVLFFLAVNSSISRERNHGSYWLHNFPSKTSIVSVLPAPMTCISIQLFNQLIQTFTLYNNLMHFFVQVEAVSSFASEITKLVLQEQALLTRSRNLLTTLAALHVSLITTPLLRVQ